MSTLLALPDQAERLVELGVHHLAGLSAPALRDLAASPASGLLVLGRHLVPPSRLAPLLALGDTPGFVVEDMTDVDDFAPIEEATVPSWSAYLVSAPERGDEMSNRSPDEALPAITAAGRSPLTLTEGIYWALQVPEILERNHCFMTIGSRRRKPRGGLDSRTPALWISNGTGRDGRERRHAPKVGWCWAGNRHTWLGFASTSSRREL